MAARVNQITINQATINQADVVDARWNYKGNIKVGNIATWSTLPSDRVFVSEKIREYAG